MLVENMVVRVEKEVDELDIENSVQDMEDILERYLFLIIFKTPSLDQDRSQTKSLKVKVQFKIGTFTFAQLLLNISHFECW